MNEISNKKHAWYRRPGCLMLTASGLLILVAFFAFCVYVPPLVISEKTTRITGPLTKDGRIDFLKHLEATTYPPEMKTDDNGFRVFLRTFGDISYTRDDEFMRRQKYEKLGLDPDEKPTLQMPKEPEKIVEEYYKQKGEAAPENPRDFFAKPWTVEEYPMMKDWITAIDAPLDAVTKMVRKPVFFFPLLESEEAIETVTPDNLLGIKLPDVQMIREIARQFQARANHRIAQGDIDGAISDTISVFQLGRKVGTGGPLVQCLTGLAIEGVGLSISIAGNPQRQPSVEQLKRLVAAFEALPPIPPLKEAMEWERCAGLSTLQSLCYEKDSTDINTPLRRALAKSNTNVTYSYVNDAYDTVTGRRPSAESDDYRTMPETWDRLKLRLTTFGRGKFAGMVFTSLMLPAVGAFEEAIRRTECACNMRRLTLALLMYKAEHGAFPGEDWFERIKPYLGENPERYLRCPSCPSAAEGTNYALILHEKEPANLDTLLFVELREPMPVEKAFYTPENALPNFGSRMVPKPIWSHHPGILVTTRRNGAVVYEQETEIDRHHLLGLEPPTDIEPGGVSPR